MEVESNSTYVLHVDTLWHCLIGHSVRAQNNNEGQWSRGMIAVLGCLNNHIYSRSRVRIAVGPLIFLFFSHPFSPFCTRGTHDATCDILSRILHFVQLFFPFRVASRIKDQHVTPLMTTISIKSSQHPRRHTLNLLPLKSTYQSATP